jgi:hypothetical protein
MDKKTEDDIKKAVIIKRSPTTSINTAQAIADTEELRKSMKKNINILSSWLKESEEIMPRPKR